MHILIKGPEWDTEPLRRFFRPDETVVTTGYFFPRRKRREDGFGNLEESRRFSTKPVLVRLYPHVRNRGERAGLHEADAPTSSAKFDAAIAEMVLGSNHER